MSRLFQSISPERFFIACALSFGFLFIIITPPFQAPDEPVHFFRSYQISTFNFRVDKIGANAGGFLPTTLEDTVTLTTTNPSIYFTPNLKYSLGKTKEALSIPASSGETRFYEFSTTAYYSPISYLPQSTGIFLGRILQAPPVLMMYLGRLCNLIAWIVLFVLAIKLMPRKKWAVVFIGLIPMALFQAASLSADVMAIGLFAVTLAWVLNLVDNPKQRLSNRQWALFLLLLAALALSKQIMFVFLPLILLLPATLFATKKKEYLTKAGLILIPVILFAGWMLLVRNVDFITSANGINPKEQTSFILHNPHSYLNVIWNTYFFTWGDEITRSFIGNFGWVDAPLSGGVVVIGYILAFLVLVANPDKAKKAWLTSRQKLLLVGVGLVYLAGVTTALYTYFTPVGFKIVIGLVGRYYLPIALLCVPLLYSSWLLITTRAYRRVVIFGPLFLLTVSTVTLFFRYYINNV